jgi:glutamine synthetase
MEDPTNLPLLASLKSHPYEAKPRLTFGVEIEFLFATAKAEIWDPEADYPEDYEESEHTTYHRDAHPRDPRKIHSLADTPGQMIGENVREHVAETMRAAGVNVEVGKGMDIKWQPEDRSAWGVNTDATLKAPDESYGYFRIEIQSPPYYYR